MKLFDAEKLVICPACVSEECHDFVSDLTPSMADTGGDASWNLYDPDGLVAEVRDRIDNMPLDDEKLAKLQAIYEELCDLLDAAEAAEANFIRFIQ